MQRDAVYSYECKPNCLLWTEKPHAESAASCLAANATISALLLALSRLEDVGAIVQLRWLDNLQMLEQLRLPV